ncbi:MAG: ferritin-like protein [Acidobacteria bacterium]|nr:ferritin-like protein [Acidobacteriota bacterium]
MSYLSTPRIVFAGQFQADPSTINNDPEHFDPSRFRSNYQLPGPGATNGWWNPGGTGAWRFRGCTVRQVVYQDGSVCDDPNVDPIIGVSVNDSDTRVEGKLVDLDSEQQMVSEIWGFQVLLGQPANGFGFRSDFQVTPFADIWVRYPQGQPDSFFSAFYQGLLNVTEWAGAGGSRFLKELQELSAASQTPTQFSIRFNVDGYNDDSTTPDFTFGRVVGSIGLYQPGEPAHFVAGRALQPVPQSPLNTAYVKITGDLLSLDLSNSLPTQSAGGPLVDNGRLYLALQPANAQPVLLKEIEYKTPGWYEQTGGIVTIRLTPDQLQQAANTPLAVVQSGGQGFQPFLAEAPNGMFLRADDFVFRLNPGDENKTTLYATQFGQPAAGQQVSLGYDISGIAGQITQGPVSGPTVVGTPQSAFTFPTSITTGADGTAVLPLKAADPGNPRVYIDGQVYGVTYAIGDSPPPIGSVQNGSQMLNALVWSGYQVPEQPTWMRDVRPIFEQYANLYPIMRPIVDLADYASLYSRIGILKKVFAAPVHDPNYMPVTRDLSDAKRKMLRTWLDCPVYMKLDSVEDLMLALQQAIELEHATIPPYLCALYSIKPGSNNEVASIIRSVVIEEMLHMALVSNLLVSLGGSPQIGKPGFVPRYPGPLPGGLRGGLTVRLRRCSIAQVRDVFMSIEKPEKTVEPVNGQINPGDPSMGNPFTIGWFYDEIERSLVDLSKAGKITFGNADKQVSDWTGTGKLYVITNLEQACAAIQEIKHQGEGVAPLDPDDGDKELAHYYKFAEIVAGRGIVVEPDGFKFKGEPIPFDPEGVWPMMDDPDVALLAPGSRARILSEQFATIYQGLLNGLNRAFNGDPEYIGQAVGQMYSLSLAARQLMQTPSGLSDGTTAGPSFQLPFPS